MKGYLKLWGYYQNDRLKIKKYNNESEHTRILAMYNKNIVVVTLCDSGQHNFLNNYKKGVFTALL